MVKKITKYYTLSFHDNYVIAEAFPNITADDNTTNEVVEIMLNHYKGKNFTIISNRKNEYDIDVERAFSVKPMKKVKAFAIVSDNEKTKSTAILEQQKFDNAFAFFTKIEDAIDWADNMVSLDS